MDKPTKGEKQLQRLSGEYTLENDENPQLLLDNIGALSVKLGSSKRRYSVSEIRRR